MRKVFADALRTVFTVTGPAVRPHAESGGSTTRVFLARRVARAHLPVARPAAVRNAKAAAFNERELCDCGLISRISFLNAARVTMGEAQTP